jgi:hypothetical protein
MTTDLTPTSQTSGRPAMELDSLADLLEAVERLPEPDRARARSRVEMATSLPALACRAELGLLALDLAGDAEAGATRLSA